MRLDIQYMHSPEVRNTLKVESKKGSEGGGGGTEGGRGIGGGEQGSFCNVDDRVTSGHFLLRLFHLGMQVERSEEVSLANLLEAQITGLTEICLFSRIKFSLAPFIDFLMRKFYNHPI